MKFEDLDAFGPITDRFLKMRVPGESEGFVVLREDSQAEYTVSAGRVGNVPTLITRSPTGTEYAMPLSEGIFEDVNRVIKDVIGLGSAASDEDLLDGVAYFVKNREGSLESRVILLEPRRLPDERFVQAAAQLDRLLNFRHPRRYFFW